MFSSIGMSYLSGLTIGGFWGAYEHKRNFDGSSKVLRKNHFLNSITKRGPFVGNSIAVLALLYTASGGLISKLRDDKDDIWNDIGGGALTGAIYKSTKGRQILPFMLAGGIGGFLLNVASGTANEGISYAPVVLQESFESLFEKS